MATLNPITITPNPVPSGQSGEIDLTFTTDPGTPDKVAAVTITDDGAVIGSGSVTLNGTPAESTPAVSASSTGSGWEIQTDNGTLVALGDNKFSISY